MNERVLIFAGLAVFLVMVSLPFWLRDDDPELRPPALSITTTGAQCVESTAYMRANHMQLLDEWRDDVVRHGDRVHVSSNGRQFEKSLSHTCMNCHENRQEFCEQCHATMNVQTYCWECHITPLEVQ